MYWITTLMCNNYVNILFRIVIYGMYYNQWHIQSKSLFAVKWELMKPTRRPSVSLVTETGLRFMNVQSPHKWWSTLSLRCSSPVHHRLRMLVRVMDRCMSLLVRLICCRINLTASSPGRLLICRSLAIRLLSYHHCLQV